MLKKLLLLIIGLGAGMISMFFLINYSGKNLLVSERFFNQTNNKKPVVIGFLPYWFLAKAEKDYSPYFDKICYFGLTVAEDGMVIKRTKPTETEPGWLMLQSEKINPVFDRGEKKIERSLVVFSGDQEGIDKLISDPVRHAENLINDVVPILDKYHFTDLNIDIESVSVASESARQNFTLLVKTIDQSLKKLSPQTILSIDVSPTALIKPYLIDVAAISVFVDKVIFMTYDFHFQGSSATGAVAPVNGAGVSEEYDTETSIQEAVKILPREKIILGIPLYGYEWETLSAYPKAAVIPGTGITASNKRIEEFLENCASCAARFDPVSKEQYLIYKDKKTGTYHQIFYPDQQVMEEKIKLVKKYRLGGVALWALGYEGKTILEPLKKL